MGWRGRSYVTIPKKLLMSYSAIMDRQCLLLAISRSGRLWKYLLKSIPLLP